jgi:dienelactone hydrolase
MKTFFFTQFQKKAAILIILLALFFCNYMGYAQSNPTHTPRFVNIDSNIKGLYEYLPRDYGLEYPKKYPLIIYFHSAGLESARFAPISNPPANFPLNFLLLQGPAKIINNKLNGIDNDPYSSNVLFNDSYKVAGTGAEFKFIVLTPQIKNISYNEVTRNATITETTVDNMIEYAKANYRVDTSRIYLCGFSMGGGAIWNYIAKSKSSKVAAVVISAGAMDISSFDTPAVNQNYFDPRFGSIPSEASNIVSKNIAILCTHNQDDDIITYPRVQSSISKLNQKNMNPPPKLISWPRGKHYSITRTFEDIDPGVNTQAPPSASIANISGNATDALGMNVYEWLLQYTLATPNPRSTIPIHYYTQTNGDGDGFYTRDFGALGNGSSYGFNYLGTPFKAHYYNFDGTIPIMRYFNAEYADHFYTKDYLQPGSYGYDYEGIEFYAYNYQYPGTVPIYRYYDHLLSNHFYTTDFNLHANGSNTHSYEGIEFYAFPANANAYKEATNSEETAISKIESTPITLFPNPTTGFVTINNDFKTIQSVIVNDVLGKTVQSKSINSKTAILDLTNVSKGIYFVKVKSEGLEKIIKVVKE